MKVLDWCKAVTVVLILAMGVSAQTWSSSTPPTVSNGSTVTITDLASGTMTIPANSTVTFVSNGVANTIGAVIIGLNIPSTSKVIWKAKMIARDEIGPFNNRVVISGGGEFVVADGSELGGLCDAISVTNSRVTVEGGIVSSIGGTNCSNPYAIYAVGSTVTVMGGVVSSTNRTAIYASGSSSSVTIYSGVVSATTSSAISAEGNLNIYGGLVIAQRNAVTGISGVIYSNNTPNIYANSTIIGYSVGTIIEGRSGGLVSLPADAVSWGTNGWQVGIYYPGGFYPVDGITLISASNIIWNSNAPLIGILNDDNVTIATGASGTLNIPENATVTIINSSQVDNGTNTIALNIPETSKVIWRAKYSSTTTGNAITIAGLGEFEVANGAAISVTGNGGKAINSTSNCRISVSYGSVINATTGAAINATGTNSFVAISGGIVSATTGTAINIGGNLNVYNGEVSATTGRAISSTGANSTITVSGGVVSTTMNLAINAGGNLNVSGGLIISQRTTLVNANSGVINKDLTSPQTGGTIAGYATGTYIEGRNNGFISTSTSATLSWILYGNKSGINYFGSFFETIGVTVIPANNIIWNTAMTTDISNGLINGDNIIIDAGASGTLNVPENATLTIMSAGQNEVNNETRTITLNIPATSKVIWKAKYNSTTTGSAITIAGTGEFEIANDAIINANSGGRAIYSTTDCKITVSGGTIRTTTGWAITIGGTLSTVTVSSGIVSATSSYAIYASGSGSTVTILGGIVSATTGQAIFTTGITSTVAVSNGTVSATTGRAINSTGTSSTVAISGGVIGATTSYAIFVTDAGTFNITGGLIVAQRDAITGTTGVVNREPNTLSSSGTIIGYNIGSGKYTENTQDGLVFLPAGANIHWGLNENISGIKYSGVFFAVNDVIVTVNAVAPTIATQPIGAAYTQNVAATTLSVLATVTGDGELSYQWYHNTTNNTNGATAVGTNSSAYTPLTTMVGTLYYYVVVTNTNNDVTGDKTASVMSNIVAITVNPLVQAETPNIFVQPNDATYAQNAVATALSITANVDDGGDLSYQWYRNTTNSTSGGTAVGTNSSTYIPVTTSLGMLYYYVVITNTNNSVNGLKTATVTSNVAMITINVAQDNVDIAAAKATIENADFGPVTQSRLNTQGMARGFIEDIITGLELNGVTTAITAIDFQTAVAGTGTHATKNGTNGSYTFTVTLSKGTETPQITSVLELIIIATPYDATQNNTDIATAKATIESKEFTVTQSTLNTKIAAIEFVENIISELELNGVIADVVDGAFTAAIAGTRTPTTKNGENGQYTFVVTLNKGAGNEQVTNELELTIIATPYDITQDNADIAVAKVTIESTNFGPVLLSILNTQSMARGFVEDVMAELELNDVITSITPIKFQAAVGNTNGSFIFTVTINKGAGYEQISKELELVIAAVPSYIVTFNSEGGTTVERQIIQENGLITKPLNPTREGFTFLGWVKDALASFWDFVNDVVTSNMTLTAVWEAISSSSVELSSSSEEASSSSIEISNSELSSSSAVQTPILLPNIATTNQVTQLRNNINLQSTNSATVEICNLKGNIISKQNFGSGVYTVSLGHLPRGMYIVHVKFGSDRQVLRVPVR